MPLEVSHRCLSEIPNGLHVSKLYEHGAQESVPQKRHGHCTTVIIAWTPAAPPERVVRRAKTGQSEDLLRKLHRSSRGARTLEEKAALLESCVVSVSTCGMVTMNEYNECHRFPTCFAFIVKVVRTCQHMAAACALFPSEERCVSHALQRQLLLHLLQQSVHVTDGQGLPTCRCLAQLLLQVGHELQETGLFLLQLQPHVLQPRLLLLAALLVVQPRLDLPPRTSLPFNFNSKSIQKQ